MEFQDAFLIILFLFANLRLTSGIFIHEIFLFYKLETFTSCKEVKQIMIMIIAITYIFLSYEILDQLLTITFIKSSSPLKKSIPPFTHSPTKNSKSASSPHFLSTLKIFHASTAERGEGRVLCFLL